ncbi:hypothetical protein PENTCL1PPCAC_1838, partial [Pristionchus entomophagus]
DDVDASLPFKCEDCPSRFSQLIILTRHKRCHLSDDDPNKKEFQCEFCGQYCFGYNLLKSHKQTHLDENDPQQAEIKRPFKCKECDKAFRNVHIYNEHMLMHTGAY